MLDDTLRAWWQIRRGESWKHTQELSSGTWWHYTDRFRRRIADATRRLKLKNWFLAGCSTWHTCSAATRTPFVAVSKMWPNCLPTLQSTGSEKKGGRKKAS